VTGTIRAFVVTGPSTAEVQDVEAPTAGPGQVVIDVQRAGVCGTDVEFYTGHMPFLHDGNAWFPMRLGHEWMGVVCEVGEGVDASWLGQRVTGDTMLGCAECDRCTSGRQHVCEHRHEVGVRRGWAGALAEQLLMPVRALHRLPDSVTDEQGAMVEPGGNAFRAVQGANLSAGDRVLILGPGTIGLLAAMFARAKGAEVHIMGRSARSLDFARTFGFDGVWTQDDLPALAFDAVVDASNGPALPARAVELVEPGKRVVYIGLAAEPSLIDSRSLAFKDVTAVGVLSASPAMAETIDTFASGAVDPSLLVAATVPLDAVGSVLSGERPAGAGQGPKVLVDPRS
jgi:2-desacetyl-2-hydroxyethyl bacteriochlorophyllide A dehydrogenase